MFFFFVNIKSDTNLHSTQNIKIYITERKTDSFKCLFDRVIRKGKCFYISTLKKRLIRERSKRSWLIFLESSKMDQPMRKSRLQYAWWPGSWGEPNPLMIYNTSNFSGEISLKMTHWILKKEKQFLGPVSYKHKSRYVSWRHRQCAVLGLHQDAQVTTQKSGRKIRPADQWTQRVFSSTIVLVSGIKEGQERKVGSARRASLLRLLCEPWQHWQSQIPKFASQNTNSDALQREASPSPSSFQHNSANSWLFAGQAWLSFSSISKVHKGLQLQLSSYI